MAKESRQSNALSPEQRAELEAFIAHPGTPKRLADRARVICLTGDGASTKNVAQSLGLTPLTVSKWRRRYRLAGIAGLCDLSRPGQPRKLSAVQRSEIIHRTKHTIPEHSPRWSIRQMAVSAGVTQHQIRQIWHAEGLTPAVDAGLPFAREVEHGSWEIQAVLLDSQRALAVFHAFERANESDGRPALSSPPSSAERNGARGLQAVLQDAARLAVSSQASEPGKPTAGLQSSLRAPSGGSTRVLLCQADAGDQLADVLTASNAAVRSLPTLADWSSLLQVYCSRLRAWTLAGSQYRNVIDFRRALDGYAKRYRGATKTVPFSWYAKSE